MSQRDLTAYWNTTHSMIPSKIDRLTILFLCALFTAATWAQSNGSNSSYSRFGIGTLNEQSQGFNIGMGGVAQGFQNGGIVNFKNPASYSAIDSLAMIFDVGMTMQMGRLNANGTSVRAMNTTLDYINAGFRLAKGLGMSFGFVPYSTIGYNFDVQGRVGSSYTSSQTITTTNTYYGNGGLHELYLGLGWNPFLNLAIGANIGYLWGDYNHSMTQTFYEGGTANSNYNSQNELWSSDIKTYKLDIGLQYPIALNKNNQLTVGATFSLGHRIGSEVSLVRYTSKGDTLTNTASKAFDLPHSISIGASWKRNNRLTIGADYTLQRWSGCRVPMSESTATSSRILIATDQYQNMHKIAAGVEYHHNALGRKYRERIHYRIGGSYSTSYVKVNGYNGPKEYGLSAGVALPLTLRSNSLINVSAQWLRRSPSIATQITENYLMLHLGITFNESWFMKWRFQ